MNAAALPRALEALGTKPRLVPACDWPALLSDLDSPGLYAWWVEAADAQDLSGGLGLPVSEGLLYIGQAGADSTAKGVSSAATLRSRIGKNHLAGSVRSSTLRCTLAAILAGPLRLTVVGPRHLQPASEARLSEWMRAHLSIAVWTPPLGVSLGALEKEVVQALRPPLNRGHLRSDELRRRLRERRAVVVHGIDDLWVAPDPVLSDWRQILGEYGQAFDGYRYAKLVRRRECSEVADEVWQLRDDRGGFGSGFADLRCALYGLQRCVHSAEQMPGWQPDAELEHRVQLLYSVILEEWQKVTGKAC